MKWRTKRLITRVLIYPLFGVGWWILSNQNLVELRATLDRGPNPLGLLKLGLGFIVAYGLIEWWWFEAKHEPREEIDERGKK